MTSADARKGLRLAVRGAESAAHRQVEAQQRAFLEIFVVEDGDESQVLREHVDVVLRRNHDAGLELAR